MVLEKVQTHRLMKKNWESKKSPVLGQLNTHMQNDKLGPLPSWHTEKLIQNGP